MTAKAAVEPPIVRVGVVDSTQLIAARLAAAGAVHGTAVVAEAQTAGRGRRGRTWHDAPGASVLVSIILRPSLPPACVPTLSLAAGVAVAEALSRVGVIAQLKWPNDVLVAGRKIAGILLERHQDVVVMGIGLNVMRSAHAAARDARATSVEDEGGQADREVILSAVLGAVRGWSERLEGDGFEGVRKRWTELAWTLGRDVVADGVAGTAVALDDDGALIVETPAGRMRVVAGDVNDAREPG